MMLVDSHCHLDFQDFAGDLNEVIARAEAAGVKRMVTVCTRTGEFHRVKALTEQFENVYCSVGTHPNNVREEADIPMDHLIAHTRHPKTVAIGESGLDYHYDEPEQIQKKCFEVHIAAARETGLPLIIHSRDADQDMIKILEREMKAGAFPAVLHCFSSGRQLAEQGIEMGFYVSFSGILTFKNSQPLRDIAANIPLERLLVETDAPYLAPTPFRGRRNEPAYVINTAKILAEVKGVSEKKIWTQTTENFFRLFSKIPALNEDR